MQWREANRHRQRQTTRYRRLVPTPPPPRVAGSQKNNNCFAHQKTLAHSHVLRHSHCMRAFGANPPSAGPGTGDTWQRGAGTRIQIRLRLDPILGLTVDCRTRCTWEGVRGRCGRWWRYHKGTKDGAAGAAPLLSVWHALVLAEGPENHLAKSLGQGGRPGGVWVGGVGTPPPHSPSGAALLKGALVPPRYPLPVPTQAHTIPYPQTHRARPPAHRHTHSRTSYAPVPAVPLPCNSLALPHASLALVEPWDYTSA